MKQPKAEDFFTQELAERYDERNSKILPISNNLHFLIALILENLPEDARVLSVGAGTGTEVTYLANKYPNWSFVAVDPSLSMLNVCRKKIEEAGLTKRCKFIHGFASEISSQENFDAVLSIFVGHFIKQSMRLQFYQDLTRRLKSDGYLVNAEISFDLESEQFPQMLKNWASIQRLMGGTEDSIKTLPHQLKEVLTVLPPENVEDLIRKSQIKEPIRFFQALMISGWYGLKV